MNKATHFISPSSFKQGLYRIYFKQPTLTKLIFRANLVLSLSSLSLSIWLPQLQLQYLSGALMFSFLMNRRSFKRNIVGIQVQIENPNKLIVSRQDWKISRILSNQPAKIVIQRSAIKKVVQRDKIIAILLGVNSKKETLLLQKQYATDFESLDAWLFKKGLSVQKDPLQKFDQKARI